MKAKRNVFFFLMIGLGAAAVSALSDADFQTAANGDGGVTITRYTGWDADITIPASIGGKTVTAIGKEAFKDTDLTGVVIPDSVKTIGSWAFSGNKLAKLTLGKGGVILIGNRAFSGNQLTSVTIGDNAYIGESAFSDNKQLASVTTGDNVIIANHAFDQKQLNVTIGNNVIIAGYAFYQNELTSITLGAGCDFSRDAFGAFLFCCYMCNGRKAGTYTIDQKLSSKMVYYGRWNYANMKTADGYKYFETPYGLAVLGYNGDSKRLSIPDTLDGKPVKYIDGLGGKDLTGVRIPDGVVSIGDNAFSGNQLTSGVTIPNSVTYLSGFSNTGLTSITIPNSVTAIGDHAFSRNQLTNVTIPNSVIVIGNGAFSGNQLTSVTISNSVFYIGDEAFSRNQLTGVTISNSVFLIEHSAFSDLTSVTLLDDIVLSGGNVFNSDLTLMSITLPANISVEGYDFPGNFNSAYNNNGKKAGTYIRATNIADWKYRAR